MQQNVKNTISIVFILSSVVVYIWLSGYFYPYICEDQQGCNLSFLLINRPFSVLSDTILYIIIIILITKTSIKRLNEKVYFFLFTGFVLIFFELLTDTLDELIIFPRLHLIIFKNGFQLVGCILILLGIAKWSKLNEKESDKLKLMARIDILTGIGNRRALLEYFENEQKRIDRFNFPMVLMLIDINKFKVINDIYGHQFGDQVLVEISKVIKANIRSIDCFCRWGGDEFIILLTHTDLDNANIVRKKLQRAVINRKISYQKNIITPDVSIGITSYYHNSTLDELIMLADKDLYNEKNKLK